MKKTKEEEIQLLLSIYDICILFGITALLITGTLMVGRVTALLVLIGMS